MKKLIAVTALTISLFVTGCTALSGCSSPTNSTQDQEQLEQNDIYVPHWATK